VASAGFGARVVLLLLFGIITSSISQNKAFVKVFVRTYFQPLPPLLGGDWGIGGHPQTPGRDGSLHSLRPSPYPLWQRGSQGDSDRCATLASPLLVAIRQRFSIYGDFIAQYGSPALLRIWSLFWGLPLAGHEIYGFLQPKLRNGTDSPAGKSGLECNHNNSSPLRRYPPSELRKPIQMGFLLFFALLSRLGRTDGSRYLGLVEPAHLRFEDGLKSWRLPCFGLNPQAVLSRTGHGQTVHATSRPKQTEHSTASLLTSWSKLAA
jgi:hypothetical protein